MGTPDSKATVIEVPQPFMFRPEPDTAAVIPDHLERVANAVGVTGVSFGFTKSPYSTWKVTTLSRIGTQMGACVVSGRVMRNRVSWDWKYPTSMTGSVQTTLPSARGSMKRTLRVSPLSRSLLPGERADRSPSS